MTKVEIINFLKPFSDDIRIVSPELTDLMLDYQIAPDGEGVIVITDGILDDEN